MHEMRLFHRYPQTNVNIRLQNYANENKKDPHRLSVQLVFVLGFAMVKLFTADETLTGPCAAGKHGVSG